MEGDGGRTWWPPAHRWEQRWDEIGVLARSAFTFRFALFLVFVATAGPLPAVGAVGRGELDTAGLGLVVGLVSITAVTKYLDGRIDRRERSGALLDDVSLDALRRRHGLEPIQLESLPKWLVSLRSLRQRADGVRLRPVASLACGHELVLTLVAYDSSVEARDLLVVRRLPIDLPTFRLWPRWRYVRLEGAPMEDLYNVRPSGAAVPAGLHSWLMAGWRDYDLDVVGHWCTVRRGGDRRRRLTVATLEALADELITVSDELATVLAP